MSLNVLHAEIEANNGTIHKKDLQNPKGYFTGRLQHILVDNLQQEHEQKMPLNGNVDAIKRGTTTVLYIPTQTWEALKADPDTLKVFQKALHSKGVHLLWAPDAKNSDLKNNPLYRNSIFTDGFYPSYDKGHELDATMLQVHENDVRDVHDHHGPELSRYSQRSATLILCEKIAAGGLRKFIDDGELDVRDWIEHFDEDSLLHLVYLEKFANELETYQGRPIKEIEALFGKGTRMHELALIAGEQDKWGGGWAKASRKSREILKKMFDPLYRARDNGGIKNALDLRRVLDEIRKNVDLFEAGSDEGLPLEDEYNPSEITGKKDEWIFVPSEYTAKDGMKKKLHPDARVSIHQKMGNVVVVFQKGRPDSDGKSSYTFMDWREPSQKDSTDVVVNDSLFTERIYELLNIAEQFRRNHPTKSVTEIVGFLYTWAANNRRSQIQEPWGGNEVGGTGHNGNRSGYKPQEMPVLLESAYKIANKEQIYRCIFQDKKNRRLPSLSVNGSANQH